MGGTPSDGNSDNVGQFPATARSTGTFSNVGLSVVLPTAGTYLITGSVRSGFTVNNSVGTQAWLLLQLYNSTNSVKVPNSLAIACFGCVQVASTAIIFQGMTPLGPYIYTADRFDDDQSSGSNWRSICRKSIRV